jgi:hypothetical protein
LKLFTKRDITEFFQIMPFKTLGFLLKSKSKENERESKRQREREFSKGINNTIRSHASA